MNVSKKIEKQWGGAIAQSSRPGFESQAHHLRFHQFIELGNWKRRK